MENTNGLIPLRRHRYIPMTRRQHVVNVTHKANNIRGTKTSITVDFRKKHKQFWRSAEGVITVRDDRIARPSFESAFPQFAVNVKIDEDGVNWWLSSHTNRRLFTRSILFSFNSTTFARFSDNDFSELETQVSHCILNALSTAHNAGYSATDVVVVIEVLTADTYLLG